MKQSTRSFDREPGLAVQQAWLFERVTTPGHVPAGAPFAPADVERFVVGGRVPAAARVEVYRHAYFTRLTECLRDDYPALVHALGRQRFDAWCADFIVGEPPASSSLNHYGAAFARFCAARGEAESLFARELAQLEWALVEAIHADAEATLDPDSLGRLGPDDWAQASLVPSPALALIHSQYPVARYYQAFVDDEAPDLPPLEASYTAVCRRGEAVWRLVLDAPFARLLERLMAGQPLLPALEVMETEAVPVDPAAVQRALSDWVACGFFARIRVATG